MPIICSATISAQDTERLVGIRVHVGVFDSVGRAEFVLPVENNWEKNAHETMNKLSTITVP